MGAHSAVGHGSRRRVTATAGMAVALVTTAATGLLTGGAAFATDASGPGGSGHSHGHGSRSSGGWDTGWDSEQASDRGRTAQGWCDVLGDVDLGDGSACTSGSGYGSSDDSGSGYGSSDGSGSSEGSSGDTTTANQTAATSAPAATPAPAAPAPKPRPTSSVPNHPTVQPIVAPPADRTVVPIASTG